MRLISTRNAANGIQPLQAVLKGIADDGGLFVPEILPKLTMRQIASLGEKSYPVAAAQILELFFSLPSERLTSLTQGAYQSFDTPEVAPLKHLSKNEYVLELFHGPTLAFKDLALQVLPRLMSEALREEGANRKILVLTATSGDTGKAALEGFKDVPGTRIAVFYPDEGVSPMQKLQMVTQEGQNTYVCAVRGNFDDAQTGVKRLFGDAAFNETVGQEGYSLSSANSINFGRLAPQIVYYLYAYARLVQMGAIEAGEEINITVPTGNFGNLLAAYYAMEMGMPVHKLICASNKNNVLTDFLDSGHYVAHRAFFKTISPSMDILISSNLERLLFELSGKDSLAIRSYMENLAAVGEYQVPGAMQDKLASKFYGDFADDVKTRQTIKSVFTKRRYLMDPHTAVGQAVWEAYAQKTGDTTVNLLASTASPFKFAQDVLEALTGRWQAKPFEAVKQLASEAGLSVPAQIAALETSPIRFRDVVNKEEMDQAVLAAWQEK